ncbi:hypothetical protein RND81_14G119000 [Saponaria officinalis]|uniref:RHOMBOID-like protein n=1 Tax=Saponaria officinalis TaxID=3572 RepID=A0AAW1GRB4_SAPOF
MEIEEERQNNRVITRGYMPSNIIMWDDLEIEWKSWIIPIIMMINVIMFIITMFNNKCYLHGGACVMKFLGKFSFEPFSHNPLLGPSYQTLLKMGAIDGATIAQHHQGWRLITSIWLHTGLLHLLVTIFSLFFIGIRLEQQFGFVRTGVIYIIAGIGGNIVACLFDPKHVSVGASSALLGLIAAMFSELLTNWTTYANKIAAGITLSLSLIINVVVAIVPYHGHISHALGGFMTGFLLGFVLLARPKEWLTRQHITSNVFKSKYKPHQYALGVTSLVLLIIGYILGLVMLFKAKPKN